MKKIYFTTVLFILIFIVACTNTSSSKNEITVAKLTERENAILSTMTEQSFVFDFHVDHTYEEVSVWVEKYEFGQLVERNIIEITAMIAESGFIIFTQSKLPFENKEKVFYIGVGDESGSSSITHVDEKINDLKEMSTVWGTFSESKKANEREVVLASIGYSSEESGINSPTTDFYEDMEAHMDELDVFDVSYVLKAEFKK
ncbi:MAG TPA: hypothetical protein VK029_01485 [Pseudogracilibacillus sp.]|nr:hypothetical protein [Pseudogracilibacillus sp.]